MSVDSVQDGTSIERAQKMMGQKKVSNIVLSNCILSSHVSNYICCLPSKYTKVGKEATVFKVENNGMMVNPGEMMGDAGGTSGVMGDTGETGTSGMARP